MLNGHEEFSDLPGSAKSLVGMWMLPKVEKSDKLQASNCTSTIFTIVHALCTFVPNFCSRNLDTEIRTAKDSRRVSFREESRFNRTIEKLLQAE